MAATVFAEKNRVNWIGVRPGVYGEQVLADAEFVSATTVLYTVPAGKTLLLFNAWFTGRFSAAAYGAVLRIRTGAGVKVYNLSTSTSVVNSGIADGVGLARSIPIEIPSGYDIAIVETTDGGIYSAGIEGILITPGENT